MNKKHIFTVPVVSFLITGCASIMSGTDQDIAIHTNPEGAECILTRENRQLRKVTTPDNVRVSKLKHDIYVKCSMDGFHDSTAHVNSGTQGSTFGNILLGGGIGWAIDSARGADNKYADVVTITMVPLTLVAPEAVVVGADGTMLKKSDADALKAEEMKKKKKAEDAVSAENIKADGDVEATDDVVSPEADVKPEEKP